MIKLAEGPRRVRATAIGFETIRSFNAKEWSRPRTAREWSRPRTRGWAGCGADFTPRVATGGSHIWKLSEQSGRE